MQVLEVEEFEDGSAEVKLDLTAAEVDSLLQIAFKAILKDALKEYGENGDP